jgi:hypothetical protein
MTDETLESNSSEGSTESPNSAASQAKSVSSTSMLQPEQLEQYVSKAVEKALQSQKDKRFSGIEKTLDGFKPVLEQVKSLLTPQQLTEFNQIQKDAEFEELKRVVYGQASTGTHATGNQVGTASVIEVLKQFPDLDANDPDVITSVLSQQDPDKAELAASRLLRKRASQSPSASAASPVVGTPPPPANLMDEFNQKAKTLRGNALIELKMQYRKKGLDIN